MFIKKQGVLKLKCITVDEFLQYLFFNQPLSLAFTCMFTNKERAIETIEMFEKGYQNNS